MPLMCIIKREKNFTLKNLFKKKNKKILDTSGKRSNKY